MRVLMPAPPELLSHPETPSELVNPPTDTVAAYPSPGVPIVHKRLDMSTVPPTVNEVMLVLNLTLESACRQTIFISPATRKVFVERVAAVHSDGFFERNASGASPQSYVHIEIPGKIRRSAGSERHEEAVAHSRFGDIVCQGIEAELVGACDGTVDYAFGIYNAVIVRSEGSGKLLGSGFVGIPVGALSQIAAGFGRTQTLVKVQILRRMGKGASG